MHTFSSAISNQHLLINALTRRSTTILDIIPFDRYSNKPGNCRYNYRDTVRVNMIAQGDAPLS